MCWHHRRPREAEIFNNSHTSGKDSTVKFNVIFFVKKISEKELRKKIILPFMQNYNLSKNICLKNHIYIYIIIYISSSSVFHGVGPLVDPFRSHASRTLFNGLPWFLLPVGKYCFITFGYLLRGILFTCCIQFLLYSCSLSRIGVIFNSFAICLFLLLLLLLLLSSSSSSSPFLSSWKVDYFV